MRHFDNHIVCRLPACAHPICLDPACELLHACGMPNCGWEISHKRRVQVGADWFCRRCAERLLKQAAKQRSSQLQKENANG